VVDGGCVGLAGGAAGCAGVGSAGCVVGAAGDAGAGDAGDAGAGSAGDVGAGSAGGAGAGDAVGAAGSAGDVIAWVDALLLGDAAALAAGSGDFAMDAAKAVRLARAVVSFAFVSSSSPTAAVAFDGDFPEVPVGFASDGVAAVAAPVAGESASSSAKILSAAAASVAHLSEPDPLFFSRLLTCFFRSAICDLAFPLMVPAEMLFNAALAS